MTTNRAPMARPLTAHERAALIRDAAEGDPGELAEPHPRDPAARAWRRDMPEEESGDPIYEAARNPYAGRSCLEDAEAIAALGPDVGGLIVAGLEILSPDDPADEDYAHGLALVASVIIDPEREPEPRPAPPDDLPGILAALRREEHYRYAIEYPNGTRQDVAPRELAAAIIDRAKR